MKFVVDKLKPIKDVLNGIKKNKKILSTVEEIIVLARMLNVEVFGTVNGYGLFDYNISNNKSEVKYELRFHVNRGDRIFEEKISFFYRNNKMHRAESLIYPFDYRSEYNEKNIVELLNDFKKKLT